VPLFLELAGTLIYKHFIFSLFLTLPLFLIHQTFDNSFAKTEDIFLRYLKEFSIELIEFKQTTVKPVYKGHSMEP